MIPAYKKKIEELNRLRMSNVLVEITIEIKKSRDAHGLFMGSHEGYAVILEEVEELWDEVKKKDRNFENMKKECIQIAAMAIMAVGHFSQCDFPNLMSNKPIATAATTFRIKVASRPMESITALINGLASTPPATSAPAVERASAMLAPINSFTIDSLVALWAVGFR